MTTTYERIAAAVRNQSARDRRSQGVTHPGDELAEVLEDLADAENYERWILSLAKPALGQRVLEVGAGSGNLTRRIAEHHLVTAIEPHESLFTQLQSRHGQHPNVEAFLGRLEDLPDTAPHDSAVMVNVLEHIDDDVDALRAMRQRVRIGGYVIVFSPAFECLYSDFDARIGHVRRYRRPDLGDRFEAAGLHVTTNRYVNLPGFFGWLLIARLLRQNPTEPDRVALYDRRVVPIVRRFEERVRVPFGQSILTIGRRDAD